MDNRQDAKGAKLNCKEPTNVTDDIARLVIGSAIEVHRHLGPGFAEVVYEEALSVEFQLRDIPFERQPRISVSYKGRHVGDGRPDFIVGRVLIVEIKATTGLLPLHTAQVLSYLKATGSNLGLLLNFNEAAMRNGVRRVALGKSRLGSNSEHCASDVNESEKATDGFVVLRRNAPVALQVVEENFDLIA